MNSETPETLCWHFLKDPLKLRDGSPAVEKGIEEFHGVVEICSSGLHASVRALDALKYAPGLIVRRCKMVPTDSHQDKIVGNRREILWTADATKAIRLWALDVAEYASQFVKDDDDAILAITWAIDAGRRFLNGDCSQEELDAAYYAADAAGYAAKSAADAARAAGAAGAAGVARYAAYYAADAAGYAAKSAADAAGVARDTANKLFNDWLEEDLMGLER